MTGLFCKCKSASLNVGLDVGINRIDLVSLWVMRHPCNQACFLAMNAISSNAIQLQRDGQSLWNQNHFIFLPVLSLNFLVFNRLWFSGFCCFDNACVHVYRHVKNTQQCFSVSFKTNAPLILNVLNTVWFWSISPQSRVY